MECELGARDEIRAYWVGDHLLIAVRGTVPSSCWDPEIQHNMLTVGPPEFVLVMCRRKGFCPEVVTPFAITGDFALNDRPATIAVHHADGRDDVEVRDIPTERSLPMTKAVPGEVRVRATSLKSFEDAIDAAFHQVQADGPENSAVARVDKQTVSRGGFVGVTQYHVELVQIPWRESVERSPQDESS